MKSGALLTDMLEDILSPIHVWVHDKEDKKKLPRELRHYPIRISKLVEKGRAYVVDENNFRFKTKTT